LLIEPTKMRTINGGTALFTVFLGEGSDEHFAGYFQLQSEFLLELDESWLPDDYTPQAHELAIQQIPTKHMVGNKWAVPPTLASTTKT
jgi:asparagine synthetase B (glutamine-hydrolysing)